MYYFKIREGTDRKIAVNVCEECGREFLTLLFADTVLCEACASRRRDRGESRSEVEEETEISIDKNIGG